MWQCLLLVSFVLVAFLSSSSSSMRRFLAVAFLLGTFNRLSSMFAHTYTGDVREAEGKETAEKRKKRQCAASRDVRRRRSLASSFHETKR